VSSPIQDVPALTDRQHNQLLQLIQASPAASDNPPISEHGLLQLRAGRPVRHLVAQDDDELTGYAQLDGAEQPATAELVAVDVSTASALLAALAERAGSDGLRLWAHGEASVASEAAQRAGLAPMRTLLQLRRSLTDLPSTEPRLPPGIRIRPFVVGQDEAGWLAVNARAFVHHPEQGGWTERDLADRLSAPWFDPAGFLLAERDDGGLAGFHWTKVHNDNGTRIGEVYVLGIDPSAQGMGLGNALLTAGLRHLRQAELDTVLLYVEESNGAAIHLYARAGFSTFATDIQYGLGR
jgi:mycothiol synthase